MRKLLVQSLQLKEISSNGIFCSLASDEGTGAVFVTLRPAKEGQQDEADCFVNRPTSETLKY